MSDLNTRIALAMGWRVERRPALDFRGQPIVWRGQECYKEDWYDPDGQYKGHHPPDSVGTLEGATGMLRDLNETVSSPEHRWVWGWSKELQCYFCELMDGHGGTDVSYDSAKDKPGDCVGEAYLAEHLFGSLRDKSTKEIG